MNSLKNIKAAPLILALCLLTPFFNSCEEEKEKMSPARHTFSITGTVKNHNDQPVNGAEIEVFLINSEDNEPVIAGKSDEEGNYSIVGGSPLPWMNHVKIVCTPPASSNLESKDTEIRIEYRPTNESDFYSGSATVDFKLKMKHIDETKRQY